MNALNNLQMRKAQWEMKLHSLSYERQSLTDRLNEVNREIAQLEGAVSAVTQYQADIMTETKEKETSLPKEEKSNV